MGRGRLRLALALVLLLIVAAPAWAADPAWLLGRWELRRDPDGGSQDWIEFAGDGKVAVAKRNGRRFTGRYHASDETVQIDYKIGSESVITTLTPSADKRELYARSAVTGKNAVYEKRP
ncbi:MAG: hypothetical protein ACHQ8D_10445 [Candidatus Rokuibacteriota bacterium]|jgi:hypothetical protein